MASLNNEGASSSSSTRRWKYAVFLSFRGEDTREGFTSHLFKALCDKGINTFMDDKLPRGEEISEELIQAIKNSSILVIVFSENYAESKWCLNELDEIVECREKDKEVQIRPIFYNVDPSEIRNQKGNFGKALAKHLDNKNKVQRWRDALIKAANASGWHYKKGCAMHKSESHFIQKIVEEISNVRLNWTPLDVAEYPVGIKSRAEAIESLLDIGLDEFCVVGIHGLPGVGKTTIAKAVYNKIAKHFDGSSFLGNVRENLGTDAGIIKLQEKLLNDILRDGNWKVGNRFRGISLIEERLCCKKVFLILDDVDDSTRIENLLGKCNWFAPGSRAIITLRDRHLLTALRQKVCTTYKVKEFEVEQLNKHEAQQLFNEHAFPGKKPDEDYSILATKFIDFANGLPLALEIIARDLCGRPKDEWESALDMYKKIPNKDIQKILRVSYDGLNDTEKDIFLDIACFFKGWEENYVVKILNACELYPGSGIPRLVNKYLITIDRYDILSMHDLIQQMGREVVRQQAPDILGTRSRLCCYKDSHEVLTRNKGSEKIRGIMLHSPQPVKVQLHTEAFKKMENLKFLIIENVHICEPLEFLPHSLIFLKWPNYPFHWPSEYFPEQLVAIEMPHSCIRLPKLIKQGRRLENLIEVNLSDCKFIKKLPKLRAPNLESLDLSGCDNLVKLPKLCAPKLESLDLSNCGKLDKLSKLRAPNLYSLDLSGCGNLVKLPKLRAPKLESLDLSNCGKLDKLSKLRAPNLYSLDLSGCGNLVKLPKLCAPKLEYLDLSYCENLVEIDECFGSLEKLTIWVLNGCRELQILPSQLRLKSLYRFTLSGCSRLKKLPNFHPEMKCLITLYIDGSGIREVPSSIEHLTNLVELKLDHCKNLRDLPDGIYKLRRLWDLWTPTAKLRSTCSSFDGSSGYGFVRMTALNFHGYEGIIELDLLMKPDYFPALGCLDLSETNIDTIPESISRFPRLHTLLIMNCKLLREIQGLPQLIWCVDAKNSMLLDTQSPSGLLNQVLEFIGILPSRVCGRARSHKLMDPQLTNYFPSETEGAESEGAESEDGDKSMYLQFSNNFPSEIEGTESEDEYESETETEGAESETEGDEYEDGDICSTIHFWGTEMPKLINHQSDNDSLFFFVGRKFPKLAVCIVPGREDVYVAVHISINRNEKREYDPINYPYELPGNNIRLYSPAQQLLQRHLNESNPTDQNLVEVSITADPFYTCNPIKRWGVHVECICPPQESANAPIRYSTKRKGVQEDDVDYLPTSKKLRTF